MAFLFRSDRSEAIHETTVFVTVCLSFPFPLFASAQSPVTLRLMDRADLDEMPLDRRAIELFERQHPDVSVVYEPNPGRQYEEKILTGLAANGKIAMIIDGHWRMPEFLKYLRRWNLEDRRGSIPPFSEWPKSERDV